MIVFSDLHGQLDFLQRLLATTTGPWLCNGDVLGAGGGNLECLQLLEERGIPCTLGNHEVDLLKVYRLPEDRLAWVRTWPLALVCEEGYFTHTLTEDTNLGPHFQRVHHDEQAEELVTRGAGRPVFIGHTHLPGWWEVSRSGVCWHPVFIEHELALEAGVGYVINLGSLGEPSAPQHPRYVQFEGSLVRWRRLT